MESEVEELFLAVKNTEACLSNGSSVSECHGTLRDLQNRLLKAEFPVDFYERHQRRVLTFLLDHVNAKWFTSMSAAQEKELYDSFFLSTAHESTFVILTRYIGQCSPSRKLEKCMTLLEEFVSSDVLKETFLLQCSATEDLTKRELRYHIWEEFISCLVSLPERIANKVQLADIPNVFRAQHYFDAVVQAVIRCMESLHAKLQASTSCSVEFVSRLIGRSCIAGYSDVVIPPLIQHLSVKTSNDFLWRRLAQKLFSHIPDNCLEPVITFVLKTSPWYKVVSNILGNAMQENQKLNYLLTYKLLLVRCFSETLVLSNILGYVADHESRRDILVKTLVSLLDVWCNKSSLRHRSSMQHVYITKAIVICVAHLTAEERKAHHLELLLKIANGVEVHLESASTNIHKIGIVTAKLISRVIDPDGPVYEFEYERDELVEELERLLQIPTDPGVPLLPRKENCEKKIATSAERKAPPKTASVVIEADSNDDLDSDDDLPAYDLSNDTVVSKTAKPYYLRDCMEGLIDRSDIERTQLCVESATALIRNDSIGLSDVAVEMAKILLHLEDPACTPNFVTLRIDAMIALTVKQPQQVAQYLCEQFYDRNYNMAQRLDVLWVLVAAAQELSSPIQDDTKTQAPKSSQTLAKSLSTLPTMENWREILQQRIESKTRRFSKGRSRPEPAKVVNRFAPVAGSFFFPLVRFYDKKQNTLDLVGADFFLLGQLIFSLGSILYAAVYAPVAVQMAEILMEFMWALRFHTEPYVRRSLIFALCMVMVSVPPTALTGNIAQHIMESRQWLLEILEGDTDEQCLQLAKQALTLIQGMSQKIN